MKNIFLILLLLFVFSTLLFASDNYYSVPGYPKLYVHDSCWNDVTYALVEKDDQLEVECTLFAENKSKITDKVLDVITACVNIFGQIIDSIKVGHVKIHSLK